MADPTPEELQTQIDELKSLITTQYEPPTGTEYSYPVVNQPMNDEMWQYVTLGIGSGVLDEGGQPYWLRGRENVNDTVSITASTTTGTAQAIVNGFYHRLTADKLFTVPAVQATTTYHFCLTYDPAASTEPGGPISLQMYAGTPPTTMGRSHVVLWKVTRRPNQLLTGATVERVRPRVSSAVYVWEEAHKPDPNKQLSGSLCVVGETNEIYRVSSEGVDESGARGWVSLVSPSWSNPGDSASYVWPGHGHRRGYRRVGDSVELRGRVARSNGSNFVPGGANDAGYLVYELGSGVAPKSEQRFITATSGWTGQQLCVVTVSTTGSVYAMPVLGPATWLSLDGVRFTLAA